MFNKLDEASLEVVINAMDSKHVKAGQRVITQGDSGHELYVVEDGTLTCSQLSVRSTQIS